MPIPPPLWVCVVEEDRAAAPDGVHPDDDRRDGIHRHYAGLPADLPPHRWAATVLLPPHRHHATGYVPVGSSEVPPHAGEEGVVGT